MNKKQLSFQGYSLFIIALSFLFVLTCFPLSGHTAERSSSSAEENYQSNLKNLENLKKDARRIRWREPWEKLAKNFEELYAKNPEWEDRALALYQSVAAYDTLARLSGATSDTKKAYAYYDAFLRAHSDNELAEELLMDSVRLAAAKRDKAEANRRAKILLRDYPQSPYAKLAKHYGGIQRLNSKELKQAENAVANKQYAELHRSYQGLVKSMERLEADKVRSTWREPWENLAERFDMLYNKDLKWPGRPLAGLGAAKAYDFLSRKSGSANDTNKAFKLYDRIIETYEGQDAAEMALVDSLHFAAAKRNTNEMQKRLALLRKNHPQSKSLEEVAFLLEALIAAQSGKKAPQAPPSLQAQNEASKEAAKEVTEAKESPVSPVSQKAEEKTRQKEISAADERINKEHETIRKAMDALSADSRRSSWREPWESLASRFIRLHDNNPRWENRPFALLDAARAYDALARRSGIAKDKQRAYAHYDDIKKRYPAHKAAEQGIFKSIELAKDMKATQSLKARARLFAREFPESPYLIESQNMAGLSVAETRWAPYDGKAAIMERLSWTSTKDSLTITLSYDKAIDWLVTSPSRSNVQGGMTLSLETPRADMNRSAIEKTQPKHGLFAKVREEKTDPTRTRLVFEMPLMRNFSVRTEKEPFRIIITASSSSTPSIEAVLAGGLLRGYVRASSRIATEALPFTKPPVDTDLAAQLGLTVRKVVIDAGHGGTDPGAVHNGLFERNIVLDISLKLGKILEQKGFTVIYTRKKDVLISLEDRSQFPEKFKADLFVSVHANANTNRNIHGFETYYLDFAKTTADKRLAAAENAMSGRSLGELEGLLADMVLGIRRVESRRLAANIQEASLSFLRKRRYSVEDGGIRSAPFHVLMGAGVPGVLVEVGYLSNKQEAKRLGTAKYRDYVAKGIADGIVEYAKTLHLSLLTNTF